MNSACHVETRADHWTNQFRYHGHPVACAAAYAVQQVIRDENLIANCREMGPYLGQLLQERLGSHKNVGDIRGRGLVYGVGIFVVILFDCCGHFDS